MQNSIGQPPAEGVHLPLLALLREQSSEIVRRWAAEAAKIPFTRAADFAVPLSARIDRMKAYLDALIERAEKPGSKKAHEILRSTIRAEHLRTLNLSSVIRNQHILRDIMYETVERNMPEVSRASAKTAIDAMTDRSVEEIVLLLEDFMETQGVLMRCLSCTPTERAELESVLTKFCRNSMDYFDSDFVALFRLHEGADELVCTACCAKGAALSKDKRIMLDSFPIAKEAIASGKSVSCSTLPTKDPAQKRKVLGQLVFDHCVVIPMMSKNRPLAVFFIASNSRLTPFTADETSMAEDLASHVVKIVENAELVDQLSVRSRAQKALIETAASLQKEIESEEIYRIIAGKITELIPCNELAFYTFDWDRKVGNPVYATGPYASETMEDRNFPAEVGFVGHVARTKRAEIILDAEADPRGEYIPGTPATHCRMLAIPILGRKDVLGVIELIKYPPEIFTKDDLEVATLFANHAAVAMENAGLLKMIMASKEQNELHMDLLMHDIANYSTPMMAYLDVLRTREGLEPEVDQMIGKLRDQVESIMHMVSMVRTMAWLKVSTAGAFLPVDLKAALTRAIDEVCRITKDKEVMIDLKLPDEKMMVPGDEMLQEMFTNLLFTAARSDKRPRIALTVTAEQKREGKRDLWWIRVSQPGRSIPDHLKTEVLRMVKSSKSELAGGFGLGLATSNGIVERYMGHMWVSDMVPGDPAKGCVYNITLPKAK